MEGWLQPRLTAAFGAVAAREDSLPIYYDNFVGYEGLREALAAFMSKRFAGRDGAVSPSHIVTSAGASAIISNLFTGLCDAGDGVLVMGPYYPGFDADCTVFPGVRLLRVDLSAADGFRLNPRIIDRALREARQSGVRVRAVLL